MHKEEKEGAGMPRITKNRKICLIPKNKVFKPEGVVRETNTLTLDEIEAIRLADLEAMDQDMAAARMEVSRATFQRILYSAHRSIADALVNGKAIEMKGGKYVVADNHCDSETSCQGCRFEETHKPQTETTIKEAKK